MIFSEGLASSLTFLVDSSEALGYNVITMSDLTAAQAAVPVINHKPEGSEFVTVYQGPEIPESWHWSTAVVRGVWTHVATYVVPLVDGEFVDQRCVKEIEKLHPGHDIWLVYL